MDILKKLEVIFRDVFDDEDIVLTNETTANDIEDWDSLAQINLIVAIRREFKINFENNLILLGFFGIIIEPALF